MTFDKVTDIARLTGCEFFRLSEPVKLQYFGKMVVYKNFYREGEEVKGEIWTPTQDDLIATDWEVIPMGE